MSPEVTVALAVAFYMLPAIVAAVRDHHNQNAIFILNLLLGWTILGWIGALIWAVTFVEPRKRETPFEGVSEKLFGPSFPGLKVVGGLTVILIVALLIQRVGTAPDVTSSAPSKPINEIDPNWKRNF